MKKDKWQTLRKYIRNGFPKKMDGRLSEFKGVRKELTVQDDLIYKGTALFIPEELRVVILSEIHRDHVGMERCKQLARGHFYWPGISKDIEKLVHQCPLCSQFKPKTSNSKQWSSWPEAEKPF